MNNIEKEIAEIKKLYEKNVKRAIKKVEKLLKKHENVAELWALRGLCYFKIAVYEYQKSGNMKKVENYVDTAISSFDKAFSLDESLLDNPKYAMAKLMLLIEFKQLDDALKFSDVLLKRNPKNAVVMYYKAHALHDLRRFEEVVAVCKNILKGDMDTSWSKEADVGDVYSQARWLAANALAELWKMEGKEEYLEEAMKFLDEYVKSVDRNEGLVDKADLLYYLEKYDEMEKTLKEVDVNALNNEISRHKYYYLMGQLMFRKEKLNEALNYFMKAYEIHRGNIDVLKAIGDVLYVTHRHREALRYYMMVYEANPEDVKTLYDIASLYYSLKEYGKALKFVELALELKPGDLELLSLKAKILFELGREKESLKIYNYVLSHINEIDSELTKKFILELSLQDFIDYYYRNGEYQRAIEYSEKLLAVNPKHPIGWFLKGLSLKALGRKNEALACLRKAYEYAPLEDEKEIVMREIKSLGG